MGLFDKMKDFFKYKIFQSSIPYHLILHLLLRINVLFNVKK